MAEEEVQSAHPEDKRVLIVDDDEGMLDLLGTLVGAEGFKIERARDGLEALEKAKSMSPDLVVLDLMLPGKSGYEVVKDLQAEGAGDVSIVVVTGRQIDGKMIELLKMEPNVREIMRKPLQRMLGVKLDTLLGTRPRQPL